MNNTQNKVIIMITSILLPPLILSCYFITIDDILTAESLYHSAQMKKGTGPFFIFSKGETSFPKILTSIACRYILSSVSLSDVI